MKFTLLQLAFNLNYYILEEKKDNFTEISYAFLDLEGFYNRKYSFIFIYFPKSYSVQQVFLQSLNMNTRRRATKPSEEKYITGHFNNSK